MFPPQGSNLQSSESKSDMLAITPEGNLSKFFTKLSLSDTLLESLLLHKVPKFGTYCILYLFGYKKAKFDSFIPVRVYFVVFTGFEPVRSYSVLLEHLLLPSTPPKVVSSVSTRKPFVVSAGVEPAVY